MADIKRKVARAVAVLSVALGAGHLVQTMSKPAPVQVARAELTAKPKGIQTVAATDTVAQFAPQPALKPTIAANLPVTTSVEKAPAAIKLAAAGATGATAMPPLPKPLALPKPVVAPIAKAAEPAVVVADCGINLDLMNDADAMIGLTLQAACHPNERVVIKHAGLAVSALTTANGALFIAIPALETSAAVEVNFGDGQSAQAKIEMPEVAQLRRFAVQWQAQDAFQVHAFENGAGYEGAGHLSGTNPRQSVVAGASVGGFVTVLGDGTVKTPLMAQIYTFPANPSIAPEIIVEAAITDTTCGRELLAETLNAIGGAVYITELTLAMPDCSAIGDYMVLKNLVLDLNIAAAE